MHPGSILGCILVHLDKILPALIFLEAVLDDFNHGISWEGGILMVDFIRACNN